MGQPFVGKFGAIRAEPPASRYPMPVAARGLDARSFTGRTVVRDQGQLGSCTAFCASACLSIIEGGGVILSPLALYRDFREFSGLDVNADTGAFLEPAARALSKRGAGSEALWPYTPSRYRENPPERYREQALDHRVTKWYSATKVLQAKSAIASGLPLMTAFDVPSGFEKVGKTGVWSDPGGKAVGAHCVSMVGYDDDAHGGAFLCQNSWGIGWGTSHPDDDGSTAGFFWVPYDVFDGDRWWDSVVFQTFDLEAGR